MIAPLGLIGLALGKKKKRGKWDTFIVLLVVCVVVGMSVSACGSPHEETSPTPTPIPTPPATVPVNGEISDGKTDSGKPQEIPFVPIETPFFYCLRTIKSPLNLPRKNRQQVKPII